jgi:hypothetical protein
MVVEDLHPVQGRAVRCLKRPHDFIVGIAATDFALEAFPSSYACPSADFANVDLQNRHEAA